MKNNVAMIDRVVRTLIAVIFASLYFSGNVTGALGLVLLFAGIVFLLTAIVGFCPIYRILGISTNKKTKHA
jgi:hypothetical protein